MTSPARLQARLFGPVAFVWAGEEVRPSSRKALAMLCYLATHSQGVSRDELAELLWSPEKLGSVRQALYELRKQPGSDVWLLDDDGTVSVLVDSDRAAFETAIDERDDATALELAEQTYLAGIARGDAPAFEEWLEVERARLDMMLLEVLERRAVELEKGGEFGPALAATERLLDRDPLNESAYQSAMRLSYQLGDTDRALGHYRGCQRQLRQELGTEPLADTVALAEAIATGDALPMETSLEHLPEPLSRLMQVLAVAGGDLGADALGRALEREPFAVADDLADLQRRRLLDGDRTIPEALRPAAFEFTPEPVRRLLHRRVAEALAAEGGDPLRLAHHWLGAFERTEASPFLLEAAREALQQAEPGGKALSFRALLVAERPEDRFVAIMLLEGAAEREGDFALQQVALDEGDALAWQRQDDDQLCLVRLKRTRQLLRQGEVAKALTVAEDALEIAERLAEPKQLARAINGLGGCLFYAGRLDEAYQAFARNADSDDTTERYRSLNNMGAIAGIRGDYQHSYQHFGDALTLARREQNLDDIGACLNNLAGTAERMAAYGRAIRHLRESLSLAKRTRDPSLEARLLINLAVIYGRQGALGPSWNTAQEALEAAQELGEARLIANGHEHLGEVTRLAGSYPLALDHLETALGRYRELEDERKITTLRCNLAVTRFEADPTGPADAVEAALATLDESQLNNLALWFSAELMLHALSAAQIRRWRSQLDEASSGNPHLALLAELADLRAALIEAGARHEVVPPAGLEERLGALEMVEQPLGYLLLSLAHRRNRERRNALQARADELLVEQGRGLPAALRETLAAAPQRWLAPFAIDA